jgi:hypothetical protein
MNWTRNLFVRAKHWQLFILFVAVFVIGELPMLGYVTSGPKSPEDSAEAFVVVEIVTAVSALCYLLWLWSMGSFLNSFISPALRPRIGFFSFTVIFTSIYVLGFIALFHSVSLIAFAVIIPLLLFAAFCMFYNFYFVSKSLVIAETGKSATFNEYAGTFFLLWFYPIGIWFIQPRINRLYAKTQSAEPATGAT